MEIIINEIQIRHHQRHKILSFSHVIKRKSKCVSGHCVYVTNELEYAKVHYIRKQYFKPYCLNVAFYSIKNLIVLDTPIYIVIKHALYVLNYCF